LYIEWLFYPVDELPPSGLQNLNSGFRLVHLFSLVQGRNFLYLALLSSQMVL
jgi:hypothetical protein